MPRARARLREQGWSGTIKPREEWLAVFLGHFGVGFGAKAAARPWVVGNEPVVIVDFQGMIDYAKVS